MPKARANFSSCLLKVSLSLNGSFVFFSQHRYFFSDFTPTEYLSGGVAGPVFAVFLRGSSEKENEVENVCVCVCVGSQPITTPAESQTLVFFITFLLVLHYRTLSK